jgi:hypothetical protein
MTGHEAKPLLKSASNEKAPVFDRGLFYIISVGKNGRQR